MNQTTPQKPITQQWDYIATSWALAALYNPFVQFALGAAFWTATIVYVCFAQSAPAVTADLLNVLFCALNIGADLIGLPRLPYLEG